MKITSINPWLVRSGAGATGWGEYFFVEVNTDEGITGWGEIIGNFREVDLRFSGSSVV